jgi:sugar phosphate isomerase/epimerase
MKLGSSYWKGGSNNDRSMTSLGNIGIGAHASKDQLQELKAKIFKGAGAVELGFMGRGKGIKSQGNTTPGMHGKEEREAIRDLAKVNNVKLTTHATTSAGSWSGFHENRFDENSREQNIFEGQRAIEFAAEVAEGGPIVVHTGEFPRPITKTPDGDEKFTTLAKEGGQRTHYLMDKKTGQLITAVREDQKNFVPDYEDTGETDQWGRPIKHIKWKDKEGGQFNMLERGWTHYQEEAEKNKEKGYTQNPDDDEYNPSHSTDPAVLFYHDSLESKRLQAQGQADEYEMNYRTVRERRDKIAKELAFWEENWDKIPDNEKWKYMDVQASRDSPHVKPDIINRRDALRRTLEDTEKQMSYGKETGSSARANEEEIRNQQKRVTSIPDYGLGKTADSLARLAIYAVDQQNQHHLKKDMFIAPENIFPEMGYGSHPEELKQIVVESRNRMVDLLTKPKLNDQDNNFFTPGISASKAKEMANRHIKATFDIGHANTWKKYFKDKDPKKFKKWMIDQVSKLQQDGILGHVHITDNFGYYDEHQSPGQGNAPIKEFIKELKSAGYKGQITVETAEQDYRAMTEMWRTVNSPVYSIGGGSQGWTDVQEGYFGRTRAPNYIFGPIAPNPKTWSLWTEVPLE